jgi:hypothetical protein
LAQGSIFKVEVHGYDFVRQERRQHLEDGSLADATYAVEEITFVLRASAKAIEDGLDTVLPTLK